MRATMSSPSSTAGGNAMSSAASLGHVAPSSPSLFSSPSSPRPPPPPPVLALSMWRYQQACFASGTVLQLAKDLVENNCGACVLIVYP
ncbi:hypothetical protein Taro_048200 [Colocasia esculenta]|uniref:Chalcone/stilbene synthase N-terminal domain-containing protein n=1 Tax=Colocasia esculenta TaxID=4460 RepID=A0A843X4X5_COLES|nr:hypothetical protein [Colocasia esculenta]